MKSHRLTPTNENTELNKVTFFKRFPRRCIKYCWLSKFCFLFKKTTSKFPLAELSPKNMFYCWNRRIAFKSSTVMNMTAIFQRHLSFYLFATCIKMSGAISISPALTPINHLHCVSHLLVQLHQQLFHSTTVRSFQPPIFCHTFCIPPSNTGKTLPTLLSHPKSFSFTGWTCLSLFHSLVILYWILLKLMYLSIWSSTNKTRMFSSYNIP